MFVVVMLLVFFTVLLLIRPRCPDCGGKMTDVNVCHEHIVYKCIKCGEEWI